MTTGLSTLSAEFSSLTHDWLSERMVGTRNARPGPGQCWAMSWNGERVLGVISAVFPDFFLAFPVTLDEHLSDGQTLDIVLGEPPARATVWWGCETGLGFQVLDSYVVDALSPGKCEELRRQFAAGHVDEEAASDEGVARSELVAEAFGQLSDEEWTEDVASLGIVDATQGTFLGDISPSVLGAKLGLPIPVALAILRGDRALTPDDVSRLEKGEESGQLPARGRLTERMRALAQALNDPSRKAKIFSFGRKRGEDERRARLRIAQDLLPLATRQSGDVGGEPDWGARVDFYLAEHL